MTTAMITKDLFSALELQAPDSLLALIKAYRDDPRTDKIDLGVGVYRDERGGTPVFSAVKRAETILLDTQETKAYLGPEGDETFVDLLKPVIFGDRAPDRIVGIQTPGGTGALRLAAELVAGQNPHAKVLIGTPTWPNHEPILGAAGLQTALYRHFDPQAQRLCFDELIDAFSRAEPGDVALLHGCCHNPTGADLTPDQWREVGRLLAARGLLPLVDLAYQGLGDDLASDATGARIVLELVGQGLVAYSCDKNFGLYRERVGALFVLAEPRSSERVFTNLLSLARANWSMPPDHGAAVVRTILQSTRLRADWRSELDTMRCRLLSVREQLGDASELLAPVARQNGLFSMLRLSPRAIDALRVQHGIYMAGSGRINVAGLNDINIDRFIAAVADVA